MNIIVKNNTKFSKKNIVISVPKKFIKKAHQRNKIKRQIRAILQNLKNKNLFIQYIDNNMPSFYDLKQTIENKLHNI